MEIPKFSLRECLICHQKIEANVFGAHIFDHDESLLTTWPGGLKGLMNSLKESVDLSIAEAKGYPQVQAQLGLSKNFLKNLEKLLS